MKMKSKYYIPIFLIISIVLCCGCIDEGSIDPTKTEEITCHVNDKERVTTGYGKTLQSSYMIYTDNETFTIEDSLLYVNFHSSDVYGKIEKDHMYNFTVYGFRSGILSSYRNIINVTECD